jgi:N-acetylmuramoyl-L-alanine amidase
MKTDLVPSSCFNVGRKSTDFVILHATAGGSYIGAKNAYLSRKVSAHYTIDIDGTVYQNVLESNTAWHAGVSGWGNVIGLNSYSIGIEMVGFNKPHSIYPEVQVLACIALVQDICHRHKIPWQNILTHAMISPGRKSDPANFTAYQRVLEAVMPFKGSRVFVNGDEITGQKRDLVGGVTINAENPEKIFVRVD